MPLPCQEILSLAPATIYLSSLSRVIVFVECAYTGKEVDQITHYGDIGNSLGGTWLGA